MGSDRHEALVRGRAHARARRLPWPAAVHAILWLDGVLLVAAALALGGMPPALGHAEGWTWVALAGSTLTAATAALAAFELSARRPSRAWTWLPLPSFLIWIGASSVGCFGYPSGAEVFGDTIEEAGQCLKFLLAISAPLLALMVFMLWRMAPSVPVMALGGLASSGAAASLLVLVHPHDAALLDLGAHALALAIILGASAVAARMRPRSIGNRSA